MKNRWLAAGYLNVQVIVPRVREGDPDFNDRRNLLWRAAFMHSAITAGLLAAGGVPPAGV